MGCAASTTSIVITQQPSVATPPSSPTTIATHAILPITGSSTSSFHSVVIPRTEVGQQHNNSNGDAGALQRSNSGMSQFEEEMRELELEIRIRSLRQIFVTPRAKEEEMRQTVEEWLESVDVEAPSPLPSPLSSPVSSPRSTLTQCARCGNEERGSNMQCWAV